MHDVVAHHMSLIAVQAETAPYRLGDPSATTPTELTERTVAEFTSLSAAARDALADLRRVLGVLRSDEAPERTPQPQLADVPNWSKQPAAPGVQVELAMRMATTTCLPPWGCAPTGSSRRRCPTPAATRPAPRGHQHRARPSADPTRRHQRPVPFRGPDGRDPSLRTPGGHGITGMRERVALLGGSLSALPTQDGGYAVSATLPLAQA